MHSDVTKKYDSEITVIIHIIYQISSQISGDKYETSHPTHAHRTAESNSQSKFDWPSQIMVCDDSILPTRTPCYPTAVLETLLDTIDHHHHHWYL